MGSVVPKARGDSYACDLLKELDRLVHEAAKNGKEASRAHAAELLSDAASVSESRQAIFLAVADFMLSALDGAVPDLKTWIPPKP